jgi:hypothetical protein
MRRKPNRLAWWIDGISLLLSAAGSLLVWHAFTQRDSDLLTAGKTAMAVGLATYLCGRIIRSLD